MIVDGHMQYLFDEKGRRYLDVRLFCFLLNLPGIPAEDGDGLLGNGQLSGTRACARCPPARPQGTDPPAFLLLPPTACTPPPLRLHCCRRLPAL